MSHLHSVEIPLHFYDHLWPLTVPEYVLFCLFMHICFEGSDDEYPEFLTPIAASLTMKWLMLMWLGDVVSELAVLIF